MTQRLADIDAILVHETEKAYLLETDKGKGWVPKSVTEDNSDGTFTLPEELAIEKGLV
jgi:hypothetical protein